MANETAVTVIEQSPAALVEYTLEEYPETQYNRLVPTETLGMITDLIRPIVQTVRLDIARDTYESNDLPTGHRAPNARGLALLAQAAGVDFPDEVRVDDASNPKRAVAKVWATIVDGTGRVRTVVGSRDYDLDLQKMTDAQRARAKSHVFENAATRARHRALRVLTGIAQSYSLAELQRPFAVVSFVPNLQHPELREAFKQSLLPAVKAMYGPGAAKQLGSGQDVLDLDAADTKNVTPAPTTPTVLPGEHLAAAASADALPDWAQTAATPAEAPKREAKAKPPTLIERLRESADASGIQGAMTPAQQQVLTRLIGKDSRLDWSIEVLPVLRAAFGDAFVPAEMTGAEAQSIQNLADSFDAATPPVDFEDEWRNASAAARKATAA